MSTPLENKIIKHDRFMDIMFSVLRAIWTPKVYKLKGIWLNMGYTSKAKCNFIIPASGRQDGRFIVNIEIKHEDLKNWKFCANRNGHCLRYEKWLAIR
jgi:hypothetical protein